LLDTAHEHRFWPMLVHTYSYNRTRVVGWGDYPLFRPCLFGILCLENALFGARFTYWQAVGMALHCAIIWIFLRILLRLHEIFSAGSAAPTRLRLILAYVLALFFAVNFVGTEMVSWCHIHGYMLYLLFVLGSLRLVLDEVCGAAPIRSWQLGAALGLMVLAAFSYETGQFYAVCMGVVLALVSFGRRQVRRGLLLFALFAAVLPVFRVVDAYDRRAHPETRPDITEATVLQRARWRPTIAHAERYLLFTLFQPLFPSCPEWQFDDRLCIPEPGAAPLAYLRLEPFLFISYGVVVLGACLALWQLGRLVVGWHALRYSEGRGRPGAARSTLFGVPQGGLLFLLLPACLIALHLGIIVLGRMNMRPGPLVLARNSYYAYTPLAAMLLGLYYLWARLPLARAGFVAMVALVVGLGALSGFSACKVHAMVAHISYYYRYGRQQIDFVQRALDRYGQDPSFCFSFEPGVFYSLPHEYGVTYLEILFHRFINHERPTHVLCADGRRWCLLSDAEYRHGFGGPRYRQLATFVGVGTSNFMIYRYQQRYYGLHYMESRFRADRDDYYYLVEGDSVADVLRQVPAALRRLDADQRAGRFIGPGVPVVPLDESCGRFALFKAGDRVYAIPAAEGPLVPAYLVNDRYSEWYSASSVAELERIISVSALSPSAR
jgi:hypothetical protein